jgi:DNA-binding response OmpR family regulator
MTKPIAIVVEDDSRLALLFNTNCISAGFQSEMFLTGTDAMEFLQQHPRPRLDLVLLDMYLPGVDGATILATLKEHYSSCMVAIITADPDLSNKYEGEVDWSVAKPISWTDLRVILAQAFARVKPGSSPDGEG